MNKDEKNIDKKAPNKADELNRKISEIEGLENSLAKPEVDSQSEADLNAQNQDQTVESKAKEIDDAISQIDESPEKAPESNGHSSKSIDIIAAQKKYDQLEKKGRKNNSGLVFFAVLVFIMFSFASAAAIFLAMKNRDLNSELENKNQKIDNLEIDSIHLRKNQSKSKELEKNLDKLKKENKDLQDKNKSLTEENKKVKDQIKDLESKQNESKKETDVKKLDDQNQKPADEKPAENKR